jgi:hypothetical protein
MNHPAAGYPVAKGFATMSFGRTEHSSGLRPEGIVALAPFACHVYVAGF